MKKKLLAAAIITVLILPLLSGCSNQSIDKQFIDALKKTSTIKRASETSDITIKFDIENSNLSTEEKTLLQDYSSINVSLKTKYDIEKKLSLIDGNASAKGMSFNFKLYQKDDKTILEVPAISKYIVLNEKAQAAPQLDKATQTGIMDIINGAVIKDNIKKLGTDKLTIGDKTSEVTRYSISLTDSVIKIILNKAIDLLSSDKQLKSYILAAMKNKAKESKSDSDAEALYVSILNEVKEGIKDIKIENFEYKGAFNKDLFIIEEGLFSDLTIQLPESRFLKMNIGIKSTTYDIDKYLDFVMPAVDKYNSITMEDLLNTVSE